MWVKNYDKISKKVLENKSLIFIYTQVRNSTYHKFLKFLPVSVLNIV